MEALAILFVLGVIGAIIVVPIAALVQAVKAKRAAKALRDDLDATRAQLDVTRQQARALAERVQQLESTRLAFATNPHEAVPLRPNRESATAARGFSEPAESSSGTTPASTAAPSDASNTTAPATSTGSVNRPPTRLDWEGVIGVRLFAWLGGGALFLAAALFLHYSIQQNLISPPVRVALGLLSGALLTAAGDRLRAKASVAGQAIAGAGIGTLYAALFAARALYHLLPNTAAFAGMILVTLTAGALAVKRDSYLIAVLGLIGGMSTPFLLSTGEDHPWALFGYVLLLDLGIAWVSSKREWPTLALLGLCASILVFIAWSSRYLYPQRTPYSLAALACVSTLFMTLLWRRNQHDDTELGATLRALAHLAILTPLLATLVFTQLPHIRVSPMFLTSYLVIITFGAAVVTRRANARAIPATVAVVAVLSQVSRIGSDLFDARTIPTLASFMLLPAAHLLVWWKQRRTNREKVHFWALAVTLASPLLIATNGVTAQPVTSSVWPQAAYTAIHVCALIAVAMARSAPLFFALAQAVALGVAFVIADHAGTRILGGLALWLAASGLAFWLTPLTGRRLNSGRIAFTTSALALPLHYTLLYLFAHGEWDAGPLGALCVLTGIVMVLGIRRLRQLLAERAGDQLAMTALHAALALALLTAALPILLQNQWLTVAFGLEVAALAWLYQRVSHPWLERAAFLLSAVSICRLLLNPYLWDYPNAWQLPIVNLYLYTFGVVVFSFLFAARLFSAIPSARRWYLGPWLRWWSVVLLFVLVNVEIADFYSVGSSLEFRLSGGGLAQDMTYSLAWGMFALVLMILGIVRRHRATRLGALLILILTVGKVFLHDLWQLGALYRVGSIVGLAIALLLVSYLVQRFILRGEHS